jgi:hypothetical protein
MTPCVGSRRLLGRVEQPTRATEGSTRERTGRRLVGLTGRPGTVRGVPESPTSVPDATRIGVVTATPAVHTPGAARTAGHLPDVLEPRATKPRVSAS